MSSGEVVDHSIVAPAADVGVAAVSPPLAGVARKAATLTFVSAVIGHALADGRQPEHPMTLLRRAYGL